jgi:cellulose synthase/poly-beta-1,6-N-acetylglucosamine synthase-like glycosyltransferase
VWIDNLAQVTIDNNVCISQGAMLLTGNHDFSKVTFNLITRSIHLEDGVWIGAKAMVCPGVTCKSHSILSVMSVATKDLVSYTLFQGNPAQPIKHRLYISIMTISIITATFNSASTVRDTMKSIASQSYRSIEHIVIDGVSKDETLSIVNEFAHVSVVRSEKDKGIYDAMNKGIALASGEIVGILNSDDVYMHNEVISKVMELFADERIDAVYGDLQYVSQYDTSKIVRTWKSGSFKRKNFLLWMDAAAS